MVLGIFGASGLGTEIHQLALEINEKENRWSEMIFVDDDSNKWGKSLSYLNIIGYKEAKEKYGKDGIEFTVAVGEPIVRGKIFDKISGDGFSVASLIHPNMKPANFMEYGEGLTVQYGSNMPPYGRYGKNVLIQGNTTVGHEVTLGNNVVVSSLSFIGGNVTVGDNTYIAPGTVIRNGIHIGSNVIIGMGSVVTKDIPDGAVAYGNPCKVARKNTSGKVFSK